MMWCDVIVGITWRIQYWEKRQESKQMTQQQIIKNLTLSPNWTTLCNIFKLDDDDVVVETQWVTECFDVTTSFQTGYRTVSLLLVFFVFTREIILKRKKALRHYRILLFEFQSKKKTPWDFPKMENLFSKSTFYHTLSLVPFLIRYGT